MKVGGKGDFLLHAAFRRLIASSLFTILKWQLYYFYIKCIFFYIPGPDDVSTRSDEDTGTWAAVPRSSLGTVYKVLASLCGIIILNALFQNNGSTRILVLLSGQTLK